MNKKLLFPLVAALAAFPAAAWANDPPSSLDDVGYILTTVLFLVGGFLVFWMAAGFAMLEAGLVRSKNVTMQLTKNIALFSCLLYTSPSPRDLSTSRMPSSA